MRNSFLFRIAPIAGVLGSLAPIGFGQSGAPRDLWRVGAELPLDSPAAEQVDQELATIDVGQLNWMRAETRATLEVPLFSGGGIEFELVRSRLTDNGAIWTGTYGAPENSLILALRGETLVGTLRLEGEQYSIRKVPTLGHVLSRVDPTLFASCGTDESGATGSPQSLDSSTPLEIGTAPVAIFDVLVCYTEAMKNASGGTDGALALIDLAEYETNLSYNNANANLQLRVVATDEVTYTESGNMSTDLSRFRNKNDGFMDEIHDIRDQFGADASTLLVNSGQYCGIANGMFNVSNSFQSSAFSVTLRSCASGNLTFGHELGHNFGCMHDKQNAGGSSKPYGYGYRTPNNQYRTVMAYQPGQRVPIMSGPNGTWQGFVMGVANSEDNARTLLENSNVISGWRSSVVPIVDCNSNGIDDEFEADFAGGSDNDGNGVLDECQTLTASPSTVGIFLGGQQTLALSAGPANAGALYLMLGSLAGTDPALPVGTELLPLVPDAYFDFLLANPNSGLLQGSFGVLDSNGEASATFELLAGQGPGSLLGLTAYHAYLILSPAGEVNGASEAAEVLFTFL